MSVNVSYKMMIFNPRCKLECCSDNHDWKVLIFLEEEPRMPAVAICKKCGLLEGGFSEFKENSIDE